MPSPINLPKVFNTDDPKRLRSDLERLVQETEKYLRGLDDKYAQIPTSAPINNPVLAVDRMSVVSVPDGLVLNMVLPQPNTKNIGKKCTVARLSTSGDVAVYASGCLISGRTRYRLAAEVHFVEFIYDGAGWSASRTGGL